MSTDASNFGLGAVLTQLDPLNVEHTIAFASRTLSSAERNLATIEKECLAIVWALEKWRSYLIGSQFTVACDHKPLQWLKTMKEQNAKLTRWALKLAEYSFVVEHVRGSHNVVTDTLSRGPVPEVLHISIQNDITDEDMLNYKLKTRIWPR